MSDKELSDLLESCVQNGLRLAGPMERRAAQVAGTTEQNRLAAEIRIIDNQNAIMRALKALLKRE